MSLLFKISSRNLLRHRGKSFTIGIILFLGAFFMTMGEAVITGMQTGIETYLVENFTGDITILSKEQVSEEVFGGFNGSLETLPDYPSVIEVLDEQDYVDKYVGVTFGMMMMLNEDGGDPGYLGVMGVDVDAYQKCFDNNIVLLEGSLLKSSERGLLISRETRNDLYSMMDFWILPKNGEIIEENLSEEALSNRDFLETKEEIVLMGFGGDSSTLDIRIDVTGIIEFTALNSVVGDLNFMDIESFRECFGYVTSADTEIEISEENEDLFSFDEGSLDDLFSSDFEFGFVDSTELSKVKEPVIEKDTEALYDVNKGTYNGILLKVTDSIEGNTAVSNLNTAFEEAGLGVKAVSWKQSAASAAQLVDVARIALNIVVYLIYFVAVLVIMNTLSMAAMERTSEIGMMRAVGAKKRFIAGMFLTETGVLSFIFGTLGILLAVLVASLLRSAGIEANNDLVGLMFGGDAFNPMLPFTAVISCYIQLVFVTVLAVIYPIRVALRITPLMAIARD